MIITNTASSKEKPRISIKYSPAIEVPSSLRCLAQTGSLPVSASNDSNALDKMDEKIRAEFDYLSSMSLEWTLVVDLFCHLEQHNIENVKSLLDTFPSVDTVDIVYGMLSGLVPKRMIGRLLKDPSLVAQLEDKPIAECVELEFVRRLVSDAQRFHKRLSSFLRWYWEHVFEEIWLKIGTEEISSVRVENDLLASLGTEGYLETCHPGLKVVDRTLTVIDAPRFSWPLQEMKAVDVFVSAFVGPLLMANQFGDTLTIFKNVPISDRKTKEADLQELAEFLKAIGSSTKFRILEKLYQSPKTTKELAEALDMAPSSISEHLKALRAVELLYPQRVKNSVYNRFLYENYQAFASRLLTYFDQ